MKWPLWSRANEKDLTKYVTVGTKRWLPLKISHFDNQATPKSQEQIIESIYTSLLDKGIRYALEKYHPSERLQEIRTPAEIFEEREGTCLDLTLLFCGLCMANELLPMLIICEGHSFAAVSLTHSLRQWNSIRPGRPLFETDPLRNAELGAGYLRQWIDEGSWLAVECTGFAYSEKISTTESESPPESVGREQGLMTFKRAKDAGREQLDYQLRPFKFAFDVAVAQYHWRIQPYELPEEKISVNLSPEQVHAVVLAVKQASGAAREEIEDLCQKLGATQEAVKGFFRILGEKEVPIVKLPETLAEIARRHRAMIDRLTCLDEEDPEIREIIESVRTAIERADYDQADQLLAQVETAKLAALKSAEKLLCEVDKAIVRHRLQAVNTRGQRGELSMTQLEYLDAAGHFKAALEIMPSDELADYAYYLNRYVGALYRYGDEKGDNAVLLQSIEVCRKGLGKMARERIPLYWALTQKSLGDALWKLGERESGTERLKEAVTAYREALKEHTRELIPLDWALAQNNLGNALCTIGERETATERLKEAVTAYREALKVRTREQAPLDWATIHNNLSNVLWRIGEREEGTERLKEAVKAYRKALEERTRERVPLDWAMTQNNLGNVLAVLGEREERTEQLEEAVTAYREALKEHTRERVPMGWATTQNNLGNVLSVLGEREAGTEQLEEAVTAYREALKEHTRERVPLDWAMTQNNLGNVLSILGERESETERLKEAVKAYRKALEVRTREQAPLDWAMIQNSLGNALRRLGEREAGTEQLEEAVTAYREALEVRTREQAPLDWATIQNSLGITMMISGKRKNSVSILIDGRTALEASHSCFKQAGCKQYDGYFHDRLLIVEALIAEARKRQKFMDTRRLNS